MDCTQLRTCFREAEIPLRFVGKPTDIDKNILSSEDAFLMDIVVPKARKRGREHVVMYLGLKEVFPVEVLHVAPKFRQLILLVVEEKHEITVTSWNSRRRRNDVFQEVVPRAVRHFLIGHDEMHLFIAQLPRECLTVPQAHGMLRPKMVKAGSKKKPPRRQGEWFLQKLTPAEVQRVENKIRALPACVTLKDSLKADGVHGKPHIADQIVCVRDDNDRIVEQYAKGKLVHPDHMTVRLREWHRIIVNQELRQKVFEGVRWVD